MNYKDPKVLNWVNKIREQDGRKPLKRIAYAKLDLNGHCKYPVNNNCPISRSLVDYTVGRTWYTQSMRSESIRNCDKLPNFVRDWIEEYDHNLTHDF